VRETAGIDPSGPAHHFDQSLIIVFTSSGSPRAPIAAMDKSKARLCRSSSWHPSAIADICRGVQPHTSSVVYPQPDGPAFVR
jgi:hypothetical protein